MAQEITIELFERNAKIYNKKGLRRQYYSIPEKNKEYINVLPLGLSNKLIFECTIDKDYYFEFNKILLENNYKCLGDQNILGLKKICQDYDCNPDIYASYKEPVEAIKKDLINLEKEIKEYKELENNDVLFYFEAFNDEVNDLETFIKSMKDKILNYAKEKDITIMLKIIGFSSQLNGFLGFNFFDADEKENEIVVNFASNITIGVDFKNKVNVVAAAYLLSSVAKTKEGLVYCNTHIVAENAKYLN